MYTLLVFLVVSAITFGAALLAAAPLVVSVPIGLAIAAVLIVIERRMARSAR